MGDGLSTATAFGCWGSCWDGAGAGGAQPVPSLHPWDDALGAATGTFSPSLVSQSSAKIAPPAASEAFSLGRASWDEPPCIQAPASYLPFPGLKGRCWCWRRGSHSVQSPLMGNGEFGKNNPPGWLLLPSFAGGWS